ncbi:PAS domain-containing protein [Sphingomonas sp. ASV193]|uniref:PAS domain-containing protein n=1 Tax=Sphingomonas sp. ASV193 TaxID=3144405 RepID=UPI0032E8A257
MNSDPLAVPAAAAIRDRYRALFDQMDEGFCIIEFFDGPHGPLSDYVHVEANAAYARHAGIENVVGQKLREMVPDEADEWIARYRPVLLTGEPIRFEQELVATGRHLELSSFRIEPPELNQVAVMFQDLTARKRAEQALRELNETLEKRIAEAIAERSILADIVEGTNAFVQVADTRFNWLAINSASAGEFERIFGVRPRVGDNMLDLLADQPDRLAEVRVAWERALAGEEFVEIAEFGDPGRERRAYEMRFNALRDGKGRLIGAYQFVYDVTDRLAEQARLKTAEEALLHSQKMEAVGQLTGGIAHDFNNLLGGISGALEMIEARIAEGRGAEIGKYLAAAQGSARRAAALTHRLLAFARRQTLLPEPVRLADLLPDLVELVRRTVGPRIAVRLDGGAGGWPTLVDSSQLENALLNLCINARDAMPGGGAITIRCRNRSIGRDEAAALDLAPGDYVSLAVADTGTGIPAAVIQRVFDPFFTTKPLGAGTGLGLSMVHGFALQSAGRADIESVEGEGTTVTLLLPRYRGSMARADETAAPEAVAERPQGKSVLVVDDEPVIRMLIVDTLSDAGIHCHEAEDGAEALAILESDAAIDLLVTDVGLPGELNGRQVADRARGLRPGLRTLFITGYAETAVLDGGALGEGMEVMTKPFVVDQLKARVDRLLAEEA